MTSPEKDKRMSDIYFGIFVGFYIACILAVGVAFLVGVPVPRWLYVGLVGAFLFVVVPHLIGKKSASAAKGGEGGKAYVGGEGVAIDGAPGQVSGKNARGQGGGGGAAVVGGRGIAIGGSGGDATDQ